MRCRVRGRVLTTWALLGLLGPGALPAEEPQRLRLTLSEAVERALAVSARLRALDHLETGASAELRGARAERLPAVDLRASYTRRSDVPELSIPTPGGPPRTIFPNLPDNYSARLGLSLVLYAGGRISAAVEAARENQDAAGKEREAARQDLVLETHAAYWGLVTAREAERVLGQGLAAFEAHLRDARNRESFGMAASNEVLAVQVERDRAELRRLRAENAAELAQANLVRLLDLDPETNLEAAEGLETAARPSEDLEALVRAAVESRPERSRLQALVRAAEARVRIQRAARLPQLGASAGFDHANPNRLILPPEAEWKHTWDLGIQVLLRVFDGGRTSAAVARAQAEVEAGRQRLVDLERQIRLQATQAHLDLRVSQAAVGVADQGLRAARENHRVSQDRYREGVIPSSELLDASVGLLQAGLDRAQALAQVRLASAELDRAVGR